MTPALFTTFWGALYLTVLLVLMVPALLFRNRRWLAFSMFILFACDRVSVNLLPPETALFFLAFAYTLIAIAVVLTHQGTAAKIMAGALLVTSITFIAGGADITDWDTTGTIQEICGLIAMLAVIFRRQNGGRFHAAIVDGLASAGRRRTAPGVAARRQARK